MKQETAASKLAVVGVFHDVNIASLYCDRLLLLKDGKAEVLDRPEAALSAEGIGRVYDTGITALDHPQRANPQFTIKAKTIPEKTEPLFLKERIEQYLRVASHFRQTARCVFCPLKQALRGDESLSSQAETTLDCRMTCQPMNRKRCLSNMMLNWLTVILCRKRVIFASSV
jgi:ABC-type sulfate/molybdate transport systems ATPase subunit